MGTLIFSLVFLVDLVHPPSETLFCFLAFAVVAKGDVVIYERDFVHLLNYVVYCHNYTLICKYCIRGSTINLNHSNSKSVKLPFSMKCKIILRGAVTSSTVIHEIINKQTGNTPINHKILLM